MTEDQAATIIEKITDIDSMVQTQTVSIFIFMGLLIGVALTICLAVMLNDI